MAKKVISVVTRGVWSAAHESAKFTPLEVVVVMPRAKYHYHEKFTPALRLIIFYDHLRPITGHFDDFVELADVFKELRSSHKVNTFIDYDPYKITHVVPAHVAGLVLRDFLNYHVQGDLKDIQLCAVSADKNTAACISWIKESSGVDITAIDPDDFFNKTMDIISVTKDFAHEALVESFVSADDFSEPTDWTSTGFTALNKAIVLSDMVVCYDKAGLRVTQPDNPQSGSAKSDFEKALDELQKKIDEHEATSSRVPDGKVGPCDGCSMVFGTFVI